MNDQECSPSGAISTIVPIVRCWTTHYLQAEAGLDARVEAHACTNVHRIDLKDITSLVSIGGHFNAVVTLSFDNTLIDHLATVLTDGLDVSDMPADELREDAAGEVANVIAGNSTKDLCAAGEQLSLTPPVAFANTSWVCRYRGAECHTVRFETSYGAVDLHLIGSTAADDPNQANTGDAG